jgi:O-antigen/teichoic acid export membrane protein
MDLRRILVTSSGIGCAVVAVNALLFYDVIVVRHFFPALVAGLYGASALVGRALYTVVSFVPTIVLPKAAARSGAGNRTVTLLAAAVGTAAAIIAGAVAVVALAPQLVVTTLAGKQFASASVLVVPYTAALGALALANIVAMYNIGLRRFAFVTPLCVVAIAEICFVCLWHRSVLMVLTIVLAGHAAAFAATLSGVALESRGQGAAFKGIRGGAG